MDPKLCYLLGISLYTRKIALRLKHRKVIEQVGDQYVIKTLSTFRNYTFSFKVSEEFQEFTKGLDDRHCKVIFNMNLLHIFLLEFIYICTMVDAPKWRQFLSLISVIFSRKHMTFKLVLAGYK